MATRRDDAHDGDAPAAEQRGPTPGQLDAAIEGARDPINFNTARRDDRESARENTQRSGGGGSGPSTGSAQGGSNSTAGPMARRKGRPSRPAARAAPATRRAARPAVFSIPTGIRTASNPTKP